MEEICRQTNLTSREINNIILAIEEGATNIIRHAYMLGDGEIRLKVEIFKHMVIFSLFDSGKSFQPPDKTRLDLKKMSETGRKGGLGFYLINKVMDRVEYFSLEGENELRMTRFLSEKGAKELQWSGGLSLRVKFSGWTFLIILILIVGAYYYINTRSARYIRSQLDETVTALCKTTATQTFGYIINQRSDAEFDELVVSYHRANEALQSVVIVDNLGTIIADSRGPSLLYTKYDDKNLSLLNNQEGPQIFKTEGEAPLVVGRIESGGTYYGAVFMQYTPRVIEWELQKAARVTLFITIAGLILGIIGIYLLSNYFVRPIGLIVRRVRKFSEGDLDSQLPLTGAEEFYEISKALNELIMRIRRDHKNIVEREILHKEMQVAEEIQKALIPSHLPEVQGFEIGTIYKSARLVGGDLFDFVKIDESTFGVAVADVSGKGVPGSLVMSIIRTALRLEAMGNRSARDILVKLNNFVAADIKRGMFVTILLAIIDSRRGRINFSSAGHNPILHFDSQKAQANYLNTGGMPVGIDRDGKKFEKILESSEIEVAENDFLLIYTDGITECRGPGGKSYGTDHIVDILRENNNKSATEVACLIEEDIIRFISNEDQHDDITMVILKKCPVAEKTDDNGNGASDENDREYPTQPQIDSITINSGKS